MEETRKRPPPKHLTWNQTQQKRHRPLEGRGGTGTGALQQAQLSPPNSWPLRSFFLLCVSSSTSLFRPVPGGEEVGLAAEEAGGRGRGDRGGACASRKTGSFGETDGTNVMAANFSKCGVYNANVGNLPAHLCWWPGMWWSAS